MKLVKIVLFLAIIVAFERCSILQIRASQPARQYVIASGKESAIVVKPVFDAYASVCENDNFLTGTESGSGRTLVYVCIVRNAPIAVLRYAHSVPPEVVDWSSDPTRPRAIRVGINAAPTR